MGLRVPGAFKTAELHVVPEASPVSLARYAAIKPGGGRRDLPEHLKMPAWQGSYTGASDTDRFFRPGYIGNLVSAWLPAVDGVVPALEAGIRVADVVCGHGSSTILMAEAYPRSSFVGTDPHEGSVDAARKAAADAGVADRVRFELAGAKDYPGEGYGLVTLFDCLHDMGDPVGALAHVRSTLAPGGTVLLVEPNAGDRLEDNLNPVGRIFYLVSTTVCVPASKSQKAGLALGAQAGEARTRWVAEQAGLTSFRRATETPFNALYEARR